MFTFPETSVLLLKAHFLLSFDAPSHFSTFVTLTSLAVFSQGICLVSLSDLNVARCGIDSGVGKLGAAAVSRRFVLGGEDIFNRVLPCEGGCGGRSVGGALGAGRRLLGDRGGVVQALVRLPLLHETGHAFHSSGKKTRMRVTCLLFMEDTKGTQLN